MRDARLLNLQPGRTPRRRGVEMKSLRAAPMQCVLHVVLAAMLLLGRSGCLSPRACFKAVTPKLTWLGKLADYFHSWPRPASLLLPGMRGSHTLSRGQAGMGLRNIDTAQPGSGPPPRPVSATGPGRPPGSDPTPIWLAGLIGRPKMGESEGGDHDAGTPAHVPDGDRRGSTH